MPPKLKLTAEKIIEAAFALVRQQGAGALNARSIAQQLGCSTQPILYQFATVADVRKAVYAYADAFHTQALMAGMEESEMPLLTLGMNYIRFAAQEGNLFRFLFQSEGLGGNAGLLSLMDSPELTPMLAMVQQAMDIPAQAAQAIFLQLFLVAHGYASLLANNPIPYNETEAQAILEAAFDSACALQCSNQREMEP